MIIFWFCFCLLSKIFNCSTAKFSLLLSFSCPLSPSVCVCAGRLQIHTYWTRLGENEYLDYFQYIICCLIQKATAAQQTFKFNYCRGTQQWRKEEQKERVHCAKCKAQTEAHTLNKIIISSHRPTYNRKRSSPPSRYFCFFCSLYLDHALWICLYPCHAFPAICSIPEPWWYQSLQGWWWFFLGLKMIHPLKNRTKPGQKIGESN